MEVGGLHGRVSAFLLSSLKSAASQQYANQLELFSNEMQARGIQWRDLPEDVLDWTVADFIVERYEASLSSSGLAASAQLVAALVKSNPRVRLTVSWKCLDTWRAKHPPVQAPAIPKLLWQATINYLMVVGQPHVAAIILLLFVAVLRASEGLGLTKSTLVRTAGAYVVLLGVTKRGMDQKVVVTDTFAVQWLDKFFEQYEPHSDGRLFPVSYNRINYWLQKAALHFGYGHLRWTSHSLRRGGATSMLLEGIGFKDVQLYGRWLSERSCREYLRKGEVSMLRDDAKVSVECRRRLELLGSLGLTVFSLVPKSA